MCFGAEAIVTDASSSSALQREEITLCGVKKSPSETRDLIQ